MTTAVAKLVSHFTLIYSTMIIFFLTKEEKIVQSINYKPFY